VAKGILLFLFFLLLELLKLGHVLNTTTTHSHTITYNLIVHLKSERIILMQFLRTLGLRWASLNKYRNKFNMISDSKDPWAHWIAPVPNDKSYRTGLKLANTLKGGQLVEFIPSSGKLVKYFLLTAQPPTDSTTVVQQFTVTAI
jgi:hypothetical protein